MSTLTVDDSSKGSIVLIPALNPPDALINLVAQLVARGAFRVIVVNDGSAPGYDALFARLASFPRVDLLRLAVNLGKGAALKYGLNHILNTYPEAAGVVTADADGQHLPDDILHVGRELTAHPHMLVIGARQFSGQVPLRSRIGNVLTRSIFALLAGSKLQDTQSGLRGLPLAFLPQLLKINTTGYDFELDMLISAKNSSIPIWETTIHTVYLDGNQTSHFNPFLDSMRIYFVLFRFALTSLLTALLDLGIFSFILRCGASLAVSQIGARLVALLFNYSVVKNHVFTNRKGTGPIFIKYLLLVSVSGTISLLIINSLIAFFHIHIIIAKILAESIVFIANFAIQRDFIFTEGPHQKHTDWDRYYEKPYKLASLTRKITGKLLIALFHRFTNTMHQPVSIAELGGANSCFFSTIAMAIPYAQYHVFDNNVKGLQLFRSRTSSEPDDRVEAHFLDVLSPGRTGSYDVVYSVGLIEHFSPEDTHKAIDTHFRLLRSGGVAILCFPTPTWLYRCARGIAELCGIWIFHDERPISRDEIFYSVRQYGEVMYQKINWAAVLTQMVIVVQKSTPLLEIGPIMTTDVDPDAVLVEESVAKGNKL